MAHSLLRIPVPAAEPVVRAVAAVQQPDLVGANSVQLLAHVTVLGPFVPRDQVDAALMHRMAVVLRGVRPFAFTLSEAASFPDGTAYLVPDPDRPFRDLTARLCLEFPDYPPYGGAFVEVIPHLSVGAANHPSMHELLRNVVQPALPIAARAAEVELQWWDGAASQSIARWPLGFDRIEA